MFPPILTFPNFCRYRQQADAERLKKAAVAPVLIASDGTEGPRSTVPPGIVQPLFGPPTPSVSDQETESDDKIIDMKARAPRTPNSTSET